ncbi:restriction endonuclease subunit S [Pseudacidovorax intermedius]|uniref:restriction endonuclease subunit S n=1 Tax=Pseudacidovorax intermedius TaxID=433924 RepID=UPI0003466F48|nr:restriction endonuclease subunit S [Pseudacidovorax intermedius]
MSLPFYAEYRDQGVDWLGALPAHWKLVPLKHLVTSIEQGWSPQCENFPAEAPGEWGVMKVGCVNGGSFKPSENKKLPAELEPMTQYSLKRGDLLISRANTKELVGSAAVVPDDFENLLLCDKLYRLRPNESLCLANYLAYYLGTEAARSQLELEATGASSSMLNIGQSTVMTLLTPLPNRFEQQSITKFLDRETGKIDSLIAEQEKLITLMAEKRQATISHAVTRGLDPLAPTRESGVAWLGRVPAHWTSPPLYMRYSSELGKMLDTSRITGQNLMRYLRNVDVQWDRISYSELPVMDIAPDEYERYTVVPGDLLVCEGGEVGRAAVVTEAAEITGFQKALHRLRARSNQELPRFMFYTFAWASSAGAFAGEGQSTISHLTGEQLRKYRFPKPPLKEQADIVRFLDSELKKLSDLRDAAEQAVALLKERRAALIAAAVTGQIDVRGTIQDTGA